MSDASSVLSAPHAAPAGAFMGRRPRGAFLLDEPSFEVVYGPEEVRAISELVDLPSSPLLLRRTAVESGALQDVEVLFSGWGMIPIDEAFLAAAPRLKAVFYAAGAVRYFVTDAFWKRNIALTAAHAVNAIPVAEYALGAILLSLKHFWKMAAGTRNGMEWGDHRRIVPGGFRSTVGIVSVGMISTRLIELLKPFDLRVIAYCPFLTEEKAARLGVERGSLERIFACSDVVSIHTPVLPETIGLIDGRLIGSMKEGATLVNTARGAVINEPEMVEVLRRRPDLTAVLDVCDPEPPPPGSPVTVLPNVVLTPHIAGSLGPECRRLGHVMMQELRRYLAGEPLRWRITRE
ncbi:MAG TPA: hydroxyacid dehydrogenase, partial [Candidatus Methylacidiphilales bacterium]